MLCTHCGMETGHSRSHSWNGDCIQALKARIVALEARPTGDALRAAYESLLAADRNHREEWDRAVTIIAELEARGIDPAHLFKGLHLPDEGVDSPANGHEILKCSCGIVLRECRCMAEKPVRVLLNECPWCQGIRSGSENPVPDPVKEGG